MIRASVSGRVIVTGEVNGPVTSWGRTQAGIRLGSELKCALIYGAEVDPRHRVARQVSWAAASCSEKSSYSLPGRTDTSVVSSWVTEVTS